MYGFHKIPHLEQNSLVMEGEEQGSWEFTNPYFKQNRPDLLPLVFFLLKLPLITKTYYLTFLKKKKGKKEKCK